jgi:hypothetical protein
MARERRSREWWSKTVARWRRSGLTAADFATQDDLSVVTLRWWSSQLGRDTRVSHGSTAIEPIELSLAPARSSGVVEIAAGDAVVRCEVGTDVAYVAALVRSLRAG